MNALLAAITLLPTLAPAPQEAFSFEQKWKSGDVSRFSVVAEVTAATPVTIKLPFSRTVDSADAESAQLTLTLGAATVVLNNQEFPMPAEELPPPIKTKVDKFGRGHIPSEGLGGIVAAVYGFSTMVPDRPMKAGETFKIDLKDTERGNSFAGNFTVDRIADGIVYATSSVEVLNAGFQKPIKISGQLQFEQATATIRRVVANLQNIPQTDPGGPSAMKITMVRE